MGRIFASDLRAKRMELSKKSKDLQAGAAYLQKARQKLSAIEGGLLPTGIEENVILQQAEELKEKASALEQSIRAEEVSVFTYTKVKGSKTYKYWKAEWRVPADGRIKQVHLGRAEGKKALSQDEALQKARRAKAEDLGILKREE